VQVEALADVVPVVVVPVPVRRRRVVRKPGMGVDRRHHPCVG